jgi:CHASE3 domain sensor protein
MNGAVSAILVLATVLPVLVIATVNVSSVLERSIGTQRVVRDAQFLTTRALRLQIDEETGVRGYALTGARLFLQPYDDSAPRLAQLRPQLEADLRRLGLDAGLALFRDACLVHRRWDSAIAAPVIHDRRDGAELALQLRGKVELDRYRDDIERLQKVLEERSSSVDDETRAQLARVFVLSLTSLGVVGMLVLAGAFLHHRLRHTLVRDRLVVGTLQRAFVNEWDELPHTQIGTAYVSATRDAAFGGDLFDVRRLDERRGYVLIADASGKGIEAAVDTAFIKYSLRTLATEHSDPGDILTRFNRLYAARTTDVPEAFLVAFFGIMDFATGTLTYASAGHAAAFLRRGCSVEQLAVTGPAVGILPDETYGSAALSLRPDDLLLLATDGLTEARDRHGELLTETGAMRWLELSDASHPQRTVDELLERRTRFTGRRSSDDLALLALRIAGAPLATVDPSPLALAAGESG